MIDRSFFDQPVRRRGTGCVKWDTMPADDVIPMWVADMDFAVAPAIQKAVAQRASHPVFGYAAVPDSYYDAVTGWFRRRHQWAVERDWLIYTTGVVPAASATLKALTLPGEKVLIQTPAYNCFFSSIRNQGCEVLETELRREGDRFVMDFDDFERKCADEKTTVFLLCNPQNPTGRVWTRAELERMNDICVRHHVKVVSDEIHNELVMPGHSYTPFAAVSPACQENSVTLTSPSKSFNIAGLQMANIIVKNEEWRRRIDRVINIFEICDVNPFAPVAVQAAYNEGAEWIDGLNLYIHDNYECLRRFCSEHLPQWQVMQMEGTYLAWVDIRETGMTTAALAAAVMEKARVKLNSGTLYGAQAGEGYLRINLACPRKQLEEALRRIAENFGK